MDNDEASMNENVVEFEMEKNVDEEVQEVRAPRKRRGPTKMTRVHGRNPNEKVVISLNAKGQAISDIEGDVAELSNFLGTLAKDNVSLTYVNWHVVPDQLKQKLWEYTLGKYVIPDEGRKWVYTTLSNAWKLHKARVKKVHYTKYNTDEDRLDNRPNRVPLEDFKMLLKYWGDEAVQKLARENAEHRKSLVETHTLGRKPVALVVEKLVKMHLHMLSQDEAYVDCIERGPHVPMRAATGNEPSVPKPRHEWSDPDIEQVRKDKKAMNILFNGVDADMFDNIISCKTAKEVWDTIQIICDGTEQVRENKMQLLIQQYEHFHNEESESLTDIFSRFQKLLNALKLHGRVYHTKDSNVKFLRSLPKEWKPMTVSLRNSQDYKEFILERLYGILKTYELEIEQDERMERGKKKGGSIALVADLEKEKEVKMEVVESTSKVCESKGKGLAAENEDSLSQDDMEDIDEHLAFLSRRFAKLKFKKNFGAAKQNRNMVDKSKFKCFKCGLAGHFANECRKSDSSKKKFESVDYKQKYFDLLKQKERAFITQENDWAADGLDVDEDVSYVNLALMAKSDETETSSSSNQVITTNLALLSKAECNDAINDMSTELYHLRVTLKSLTKEKAKIKENNLFLSERNNVFESQFVEFEKLKIECRIAKEELTESLKKEEILKKQLDHEQEVIKAWKTSRDVHAQSTKVQGIESFYVDSTDDEDYPSDNKKCYPSNDKNSHPSAISKPISKAKLTKLNDKYGSVSKNFVSGESNQAKKGKKANVGHMTVKQLSDRLEKIEVKTETKRKNNRNGKVGINKHNNYTPDKYAPRKICVKCGSVNHLSVNCKSAMPTPMSVQPQFSNMNAMPPMPVNDMPTQNMNAQFAIMPFVPNTYYTAYSPTQMTKEESEIPKSNELRPKKQKKKANKAGPNETWVPKSN
ncbi:hypothetical protein AgCh_027252 [Apium graveolens]